MWCIIPRHMATAVTAWGRTAAGKHKAFNTEITLLPTDFAKLELNLSFKAVNLFMGIKEEKQELVQREV